jgi:hypothetical protein
MYALFTHGAWSAVIRGSAHSPAAMAQILSHVSDGLRRPDQVDLRHVAWRAEARVGYGVSVSAGSCGSAGCPVTDAVRMRASLSVGLVSR